MTLVRTLGITCAVIGVSHLGFSALPSATPESQGVSSRAIRQWVEACEATSATNGFRRGYLHGFVLVRHGKVIAEGSWAPQDTLHEPHMLYSLSKSFTSTAIGFLVDDGKLDLDERVIGIFPDKAPAEPSENLRQLRVRDLLTMNVGADRTDSENDDIKGDWVRAFLANEVQRAPGTGFKYDSGATHLLAAIVERKTGMKLMDFLGERLFRPLGMTSPWSTTSPTGVACGGWGMNMTTRDMATFGQFLLQKGQWNGTRLLSSEWIDLASARQTWSSPIIVAAQTVGSGSDWVQGYGFQFWRCRFGAFRADGASGQLSVVFPKEDAVLSVHAGLGDMQLELDLVWRYLLPAFGDGILPEDAAESGKLAAKCAALALPLEDAHEEPFEDMDQAAVERTADGWTLVRGDRRLAVGEGRWKMTEWKYTGDLVEPLFHMCGTRRIAANGRLAANGDLVVSWQMLGGIRSGRFAVKGRQTADSRELFNGRDLAGWYKFLKGRGRNNDPKGVITVTNGVIRITGEEFGCLTTEEEFSDYRLTVEYRFLGTRFAAKRNMALDSGILFHSVGEDGGFAGIWMASHEYNLIVGASGDFWTVHPKGSGMYLKAETSRRKLGRYRIWEEGGEEVTITGNDRICRSDISPAWTDTPAAPLAENERPVGEWNTAVLECRGDSVDCHFNGKHVNHATHVSPFRGKIQLQSEACGVEFRRVTLERLADK